MGADGDSMPYAIALLEDAMTGSRVARIWRQAVCSFMRSVPLGMCVATCLGLSLSSAQAQAGYPSKPVRLVVGFAPGGGNDIFARLIAAKLRDKFGWAVSVENRPGGGGRTAAEFVAREPADGYTILMGASGAMAMAPAISSTGYDTLKSFAPVTMIGDFPLFLVVNANHPAKNVAELVAWSKANPQAATYATSSPAFTLPVELFKLRTGALGVAMSSKSSGESILNILAGHAAMTIADPPPAVPQVQAGKLRALAVTGVSRSNVLPDVPTMTEAGVKGMNISLWSGLFVPARTPKPVINKIARDVREVLLNTDVKDKLAALGIAASGMSPEAFARHIEAEIRMWRAVVKEGSLKFDG